MALINVTPFFDTSNDILFGRDGFTITNGIWAATPGEAILTTNTGATDNIVDAVNFIPDYRDYDIEFELEVFNTVGFFAGLASNTNFSGNGEYCNSTLGDIRTKTGAIFHSFGGPLADGDKLRFLRTSSPSHNLEIFLNDVSVISAGIANSGYTPYLGFKNTSGSAGQGNGVRNFKQNG